MELKGSRTEANLMAAFAGESQARNKYTYYASKAKKEGYEQIAALFLETAENEKEDIARREQEEKKDKTDFKMKLEPVINKWIESKGFVKPNLTIKDVAQEIGTNQNYLSKYINSIEGITFTVWLNRLRIEESKVLLLSPEKYSIEEIGKSVGITELYNFSRWFKVVTEMTPQQYRKANSVK